MDHQPLTTTGRLRVDLTAIADNFRLIDQKTPGAEVAGVVKADAYGLGVEPVASALWEAGCQTFYVAEVGEAVELRAVLDARGTEAGHRAVICVLAGAQPGTVDDLEAARAVPVLLGPDQVQRWAATADGKPRPGIIHLDTGMARTGFDRPGLAWLLEHPAELERLHIGTMLSHLACADEPDHPLNRQQLQQFQLLRQQLGIHRGSLANTAGIALGPDFHAEEVRPGLGLYGVEPVQERPLGLRPVISLTAPVLQVRAADKGDTVGYGASFSMPTDGRLAVLGLGYGDGFPRSLSNRGQVNLNGYRAPIVGRVSMDLTVVDISAIPDGLVQPGDQAEVLGEEVTPAEVAEAADTIAYELLTNLGRRYQRSYGA